MCCYPFVVNLDRYVGSCNTFDDFFNKVYVPNKREDLNLSVLTWLEESINQKVLAKHISCKCECKYDSRNCNSNQKCNNDKCMCDSKNPEEHNSCGKRLYLESCYT